MNKTGSKIVLLSLLISFFIFNANSQQDDRHFEVSKNLNIFNSIFKELNLFYVDSIQSKDLIELGVRSMLRSLDPYTEYIPEDKMPEFKFMITGEYAGIGAIIVYRDGKILIVDPYEGMPAANNGLRVGDELLEIDGVSMEGKNSSDASEKLKGPANTKVKIKFLRAGEKNPRTVEIERKLIHVNPVTYYGVVKDSVGYIALSSFTDGCFQVVRDAFEDLRENKGIKSLILDLRDNGGGSMEEALQILNMFVPKGKVLLTMKGRTKQMERVSRATQNPVDTVMPLAVMINEGSASASEIVAGALQDLDRAVIVGRRSFGKGLVQTPRELPFNGQLKVTTYKYYIPSGRCVQAIDYAHRDSRGYADRIPDSLTSVFYTEKGRLVRDGGGITPDFTVEEVKTPNIYYYMEADGTLMDFVVQWRIKHPKIDSPSGFALTEQDYNDFKEFVKGKDFKYDRQSEKALASLKELMEFEGYMTAASEEFKALEQKLQPDLDRDFEMYKERLSKLLAMEIMRQYYYAKGVLIYTLRDDNDLDKTIEVLDNLSLYHKTLSEYTFTKAFIDH
jgi:carboxyl-terminal processing protease